MNHHVVLAIAAKADLRGLIRYVAENDSIEHANELLDAIERTISSLALMPQRGHFPPELERIGIREFREVHLKPYRIMYVIHGRKVTVLAILDGRRDMQTLLQQRLLR